MIVLDAYGNAHELADNFDQDFEISLPFFKPWGNLRLNRFAESAIKIQQKTHVRAGCEKLGIPPRLPCTIVLHRVTHRGELDDDNVPDACKYVRDEIARWMGLKSDRSRALKFRYGQQKTSRVGFVGVRVSIIQH